MLMAIAGAGDLPVAIVPGGVTLPATDGEDAGTVQTIGARFSHGLISLEEAAALGCRACASPGGGCQFLGTAASAQVVSEALGLAVPHSALAPSGQPIWLDGAARAVYGLQAQRALGWSARIDRHRRRDPQCDGRARGIRRLDEPAAARAGDRACRWPDAPGHRRLDGCQPCRAAPGRRAACRAASDRPRPPGGRRSRGAAAPARARPARDRRADLHRPDARRRARLVGAERTPPALPPDPARPGRRRSRSP